MNIICTSPIICLPSKNQKYNVHLSILNNSFVQTNNFLAQTNALFALKNNLIVLRINSNSSLMNYKKFLGGTMRRENINETEIFAINLIINIHVI